MSNEFDPPTETVTAPVNATVTATGIPAPASARPVRVGTVVWGFILIGLAAMFFTFAQVDLSRFNPAIVLTWVILGVGALAVVGGIVGALLRRRH
jgi:hypothetical protein